MIAKYLASLFIDIVVFVLINVATYAWLLPKFFPEYRAYVPFFLVTALGSIANGSICYAFALDFGFKMKVLYAVACSLMSMIIVVITSLFFIINIKGS